MHPKVRRPGWDFVQLALAILVVAMHPAEPGVDSLAHLLVRSKLAHMSKMRHEAYETTKVRASGPGEGGLKLAGTDHLSALGKTGGASSRSR